MSRLPSLSLAGLVVVLCLGPPARVRPQEGPPAFPTTAELVVLDLVARDKAGRMITDLRPDDVEVLEDGQRWPVQWLRLVQAGVEAAVPAASTAAPGAGPTPRVSASPVREALPLAGVRPSLA